MHEQTADKISKWNEKTQMDGWLHGCKMNGYGKMSICYDEQVVSRAIKTKRKGRKTAAFTRKPAIIV